MSYIKRIVDDIVDLHYSGFSDEAIADDLDLDIQDVTVITKELED